jgi:6-phosphogluconolactonase
MLMLACGSGTKTSGGSGSGTSGISGASGTTSAQNHFVFVANKDKDSVTELTIDAATAAATVPTGTNQANANGSARAVVTDPSGSHVYVATSSGIAAFALNQSNGNLSPIIGSPFALSGSTPTDMAVDPTGTFLYVVFNGSNQVASYPISQTDGSLGTPMTAMTGSGPISVITDPTSKFVYVANENSFTISGFLVDPNNGALTPISGSPFNGAPNASPTTGPAGMAIANNFLYVASDGQILTLSINTSTGALSSSGTPFPRHHCDHRAARDRGRSGGQIPDNQQYHS